MFTQTVSYSAAFLAGLLSFLSPCRLAVDPGLFYALSPDFPLMNRLINKPEISDKKFSLSTLAFVCGFSFVFIIMGVPPPPTLAALLTHTKIIFGSSAESIIILFGIHLTGWIQLRGLNIDRRFHLQNIPLHFMGTFIIGMAFGAGWSPRIGPLLGSILLIASSKETIWQGIELLALYSAGMAIPFILISIFINFLLEFLQRANRIIRYVNRIAGILLILVGIFLLTDSFTLIYSLLTSH